MTKTAAAKRFANSNGVYDPDTRQYAKSVLFDYKKDYDRARDMLDEERRQHAADLRTVMTLLGVEDQYEDTREYAGTFQIGLSPTQQFARDLRAASAAIDGEAALKRLRKTVKNLNKEPK